MKKGLLGLVILALTIVGCQNYDDQFDELNDKILTLSQRVLVNLMGFELKLPI